ncbi:MAG: hypothetical protein E6700_01225 [Winkia neuii]|uniref:Uncharacterized protein n=1 Tax=Winkia neuii TaxID=33007 RepID=A0A2I1IPS3_9ACTO|nr:hypothetical protein [Winkia neuii]OFJ72133.1 hypothetical protein HMPREF2851_04175 [Actinomyces sp. HMSC064C12]OFK02154.1 hypothetical protein HMPREF2835_07415 [Actinomyces sp. HMSC072A03]OFT54654.1 hypothetical protein HMPREF3152_09300 [Actinomyces sp. HMSC06A08]KWZ74188.1 hypothetical protein HMPREF3198_00745 [Winkia neuii]MDK8098621.1 hypothetical protein [Winkia neuii]
MTTGLAGPQVALIKRELESVLCGMQLDFGIWQGKAANSARAQAEAIRGELVALNALADNLHAQVVAAGA